MSDRDKKIPDKFKDVTGFTFTTVGGEMMIVFHGFYDDSDMPEFAEFVFSRLKMDLPLLKEQLGADLDPN